MYCDTTAEKGKDIRKSVKRFALVAENPNEGRILARLSERFRQNRLTAELVWLLADDGQPRDDFRYCLNCLSDSQKPAPPQCETPGEHKPEAA